MSFAINRLKGIKITYWLLIILGLSFIFSLCLFLLNSKSNQIYYVQSFIVNHEPVGNDSWNPMIEASEHLKKHPEKLVYEELFFKNGVKFQYPLSSLLIYDIPNRLFGIPYSKVTSILNNLSLLSVFLIGIISANLLIGTVERNKFSNLKCTSKIEIFCVYLLIFMLTILFYPIMRSYILGQIQTILTCLVSLAILCWYYDRKRIVGILIGIVCLIKPQLGLIFIWAIIRKQWSLLISGLITVAVFLIISIAFYGFSNSIQYLEVLSFLSRHGEAYYANHSINGLMNRLSFNGENLVWDGGFPPYSSIVYVFTLISSLVFMLLGLLWKYRSKNPGVLDFCIIILCTTIASPISWEHHYGVLFPIIWILFPLMLSFFEVKKWLFFFICYILVSQYLGFVKYFADTSFNFIQSYLLFGAIGFLAFLLILSKKIMKIKIEDL